jgi:hypothetical protein
VAKYVSVRVIYGRRARWDIRVTMIANDKD